VATRLMVRDTVATDTFACFAISRMSKTVVPYDERTHEQVAVAHDRSQKTFSVQPHANYR